MKIPIKEGSAYRQHLHSDLVLCLNVFSAAVMLPHVLGGLFGQRWSISPRRPLCPARWAHCDTASYAVQLLWRPSGPVAGRKTERRVMGTIQSASAAANYGWLTASCTHPGGGNHFDRGDYSKGIPTWRVPFRSGGARATRHIRRSVDTERVCCGIHSYRTMSLVCR